jgi:hypothetical protein
MCNNELTAQAAQKISANRWEVTAKSVRKVAGFSHRFAPIRSVSHRLAPFRSDFFSFFRIPEKNFTWTAFVQVTLLSSDHEN